MAATNITPSLINHAGENGPSPPTLSLSLSSVSGTKPPTARCQGPSTALALPSTKHNLDVVGNGSMQSRCLFFTEPNLPVIICDSKAPHHDTIPLSPSLRDRLSTTPDGHGSSLHVDAPWELSSFQPSVLKLYSRLDGGDTASQETPSTAPGPFTIHCATIASQASKDLNYHLNPDGIMYRWGAEDGPIPISINLDSFESEQQGLMVQRCLEAVVCKLNDLNVGVQFELVQRPSESAFFVTYGAGCNDKYYATAFLPGSAYKDWYIYVYNLGLQLDEPEIVGALTHEMMHVIGLRHCYVDPDIEKEPYVRYPHGISDDENREPVMEPKQSPSELSKLDLRGRIVEDLRSFYALKTGERIDGYEIQDVSWKAGAVFRKAIALSNACLTKPKL